MNSIIKKTDHILSLSVKKLKSSTFRGNVQLFLLTFPAIAYFLIFSYLPMFGVILAFKDYKYNLGILRSPWVGFKNFEFFFKSQDAWRITRNTVLYSASFIVIGTIVSITVAILLFEIINNRKATKVYQTSMILPRFMSWVIVGYISYAILNPQMGILNRALALLGVEPINWYSEIKYWPFILIITNVWKHVGMDCIIYYAALMSIDTELYEAARIDGASRVKQIRYISIPSIIPLIIILCTLAVGNIFRSDFGLFYQITQNVTILYPVTDVIDTYLFRGLRNGDMSPTTAVGLFQSAVGFVIVLTTNFIVRKIDPEKSLF